LAIATFFNQKSATSYFPGPSGSRIGKKRCEGFKQRKPICYTQDVTELMTSAFWRLFFVRADR